jgi:hypothetical protein
MARKVYTCSRDKFADWGTSFTSKYAVRVMDNVVKYFVLIYPGRVETCVVSRRLAIDIGALGSRFITIGRVGIEWWEPAQEYRVAFDDEVLHTFDAFCTTHQLIEATKVALSLAMLSNT